LDWPGAYSILSNRLENEKTFCAKEIALRWKTSYDRVLRLIRYGELPAFDISLKCNSRRPTYRVHQADLLAFEMRRKTILTVPVKPLGKKKGGGIKKFF